MSSTHFVIPTPLPRVLVIDDTSDNLFLMAGLLEDQYQVVQAASGKEGLAVIMSDAPPDMVLLDIMMPEMDGYEVLRRIRQHPPTANIPVIFLTALAGPQDERLGMDLGAIDYLTKPVDPEQVIARVEHHVREIARARRMEALSEKLSRHLMPDAWQKLFQGADTESVVFEQKTLTVLYAETTHLPSWGDHARDTFAVEGEALARRHQGTLDPFVFGATVVFFEQAQSCLRMALDLQRTAVNLKLRVGIHTGLYEVATFRTGGLVHQVVVGQEAVAAAKVASCAAAGSITLSSQAYALVRAELNADANGCLSTEDLGDDEVAVASVTPGSLTPATAPLVPAAEPALSTFAD